MNQYISGEIVKKILEDKGTEIEAIVRCYDFPPVVRNISPLYQMFTKNNTKTIVSYDLFKMYIAIIYYLKVQLEDNSEKTDLEHIEYDLGYCQYHLMKKFEDDEIEAEKYEEELCHAYEKTILKYLFLIQLFETKDDQQLNGIKNAVLTMNDNTLIKLGFVHRLSNFKTKVNTDTAEEHRERLEYYSSYTGDSELDSA